MERMLRAMFVLVLLADAASFRSSRTVQWRQTPCHALRPRPRPLSLSLRAASRDGSAAAGRAAKVQASSAYIHIPFCKQRCYYCDFPVSVVGADTRRPGAKRAIDRYLDSLATELDRGGGGALAPARPSREGDIGTRLKTIYLGGGTPSLLEPQQVDRILHALDNRFGIEADAEISMEMDPGTFDFTKAAGVRAAGVNRVSLGVQSFADEQLRACGRGHGVSEVEDSVSMLRAAGFHELSLDIMSGLPGDSVEGLETSLEKAVALGPTHLSVYDLIVEQGTAFGRWYLGDTNDAKDSRSGRGGARSGEGSSVLRELPAEDVAGEMFCAAHAVLARHGFEHYEISSFARLPPGAPAAGGEDDGARSPHRSRHNLVYWRHEPFLAFGMGATSYIDGARLARPRSLETYSQWIDGGGAGDALVGGEDAEEEDEEAEDAAWADLVEVLMVGLRMRVGLELAVLKASYGEAAVARALR